MKPPSSPSPVPSGPKEIVSGVLPPVEAEPPATGGNNDAANFTTSSLAEKNPPLDLTSGPSPYPV